MHKYTIIIFIGLLVTTKANSQITKGNWMLGGNIAFSSTNAKSDASSRTVSTNLQIMPHIGYFVADKFAVGLNTNISRQGYKIQSSPSIYSTFTDFNTGPFIRYYILPKEGEVNIVTEASYLYGFAGGNQASKKPSKSTFAFAAGPVVYFNNSVGLEFFLRYSTYKYAKYAGSNNTLQLELGLQVHLEKDNK